MARSSLGAVKIRDPTATNFAGLTEWHSTLCAGGASFVTLIWCDSPKESSRVGHSTRRNRLSRLSNSVDPHCVYVAPILTHVLSKANTVFRRMIGTALSLATPLSDNLARHVDPDPSARVFIGWCLFRRQLCYLSCCVSGRWGETEKRR